MRITGVTLKSDVPKEAGMNGERSDTLSTYRHLRLAMPLLLVMLLVAVGQRALSAPPGVCFEGSISGYYFTSVRAVFVTTLCALGTCLIVYRGNREDEDIALNVSGALAFVVAFVPTRVPSDTDVRCSASNVPKPDHLEEAVTNNMWAMNIAFLAAIVVAMILVARSNRKAENPSKAPMRALWVSLGVLVLGTIAFVRWQDGFRANAHTAAAFGTFIGILAVVALNALNSGRRGRRRSVSGLIDDTVGDIPSAERSAKGVNGGDLGAGGDQPDPDERRLVIARKWYVGVAAAMVATMAIISLLYWRVSGWRHGVLWIEGLLLGEFLVFWVVQTYELWNVTRRDGPRVDTPTAGIEPAGTEAPARA